MLNKIKFALEGRSPKWEKVRKEFLKTKPRCEACSSHNHLEVHHIKPFHRFPELELEPKNLMTLCRSCHLVLGHLRDFDIYNRNVRLDVDSFMMKRIEAMALECSFRKVCR
jgi:hypothetical protein